MRHAPAVLMLLAVIAVPVAHAGTAEAPELTDPAGDCEFAPGNSYMDIVAAWVSDETADGFNVNLQLGDWVEPLAGGAGYTVQFQHQGVQFGIVAAYMGPSMGWYFANGYIAEDESSDFTETSGSFTAPVITVLFLKSNFPHADANDNRLVQFTAGSIDMKLQVPFFFVPAQSPVFPPAIACDGAEGQGTYTFAVGDHSQHAAGNTTTPDASSPDGTQATTQPPTTTPEAVAPASAPENDVPAPGLLLVAGAVAVAAFARRLRA